MLSYLHIDFFHQVTVFINASNPLYHLNLNLFVSDEILTIGNNGIFARSHLVALDAYATLSILSYLWNTANYAEKLTTNKLLSIKIIVELFPKVICYLRHRSIATFVKVDCCPLSIVTYVKSLLSPKSRVDCFLMSISSMSKSVVA